MKKPYGFTLVELIVAVAILSITAAITTPALTGYLDKGSEQKAVAEAHACVAAAESLAAQRLMKGTLEGWADWDGSPPDADLTGFRHEGQGYYVKTGGGQQPARAGACAEVTEQAETPGAVTQLWCNGDGAVARLVYVTEGYTVVYARAMTKTGVPRPVPVPEPEVPIPEPTPTKPPECVHEWTYSYLDSDRHTKTCTKCGAQETESHQPDLGRLFDETYHWQVCALCGSALSKQEHSYRDNPWVTEGTVEKQKCDACDHTRQRTASQDKTFWLTDTRQAEGWMVRFTIQAHPWPVGEGTQQITAGEFYYDTDGTLYFARQSQTWDGAYPKRPEELHWAAVPIGQADGSGLIHREAYCESNAPHPHKGEQINYDNLLADNGDMFAYNGDGTVYVRYVKSECTYPHKDTNWTAANPGAATVEWNLPTTVRLVLQLEGTGEVMTAAPVPLLDGAALAAGDTPGQYTALLTVDPREEANNPAHTLTLGGYAANGQPMADYYRWSIENCTNEQELRYPDNNSHRFAQVIFQPGRYHAGGTFTVNLRYVHTGHWYELKKDAQEPTCQQTGSIRYYQCPLCEKFFREENGNWYGISEQDAVLAMVDHAMQWMHDDTHHWQACRFGCGEKTAPEPHSWTNWNLEWKNNAKYRQNRNCTVCGALEQQYYGQVRVVCVDQNGQPLTGSHCCITNEDGTLKEDLWNLGSGSVMLLPGTYTVREEGAPTDYGFAADSTITVPLRNDGPPDPVTCTLTHRKMTVELWKRSSDGTPLAGALLSVLQQSDNNVRLQWTSTEQAKTVDITTYWTDNALQMNTSYLLRENAPPTNYQPGGDIAFHLEWNRETQRTEVVLSDTGTRLESLAMYNVPVQDGVEKALRVYKQDETGRPLVGASLSITPFADNSKGGGDSWTSSGSARVLPVKNGSPVQEEVYLTPNDNKPDCYTLSETSAPAGCAKGPDMEFYIYKTTGNNKKYILCWRYKGETDWRTSESLTLVVTNTRLQAAGLWKNRSGTPLPGNVN